MSKKEALALAIGCLEYKLDDLVSGVYDGLYNEEDNQEEIDQLTEALDIFETQYFI